MPKRKKSTNDAPSSSSSSQEAIAGTSSATRSRPVTRSCKDNPMPIPLTPKKKPRPETIEELNEIRGKKKPAICCALDFGFYRCQLEAGPDKFTDELKELVIDKKMDTKPDAKARHLFICPYHKCYIEKAPSSDMLPRASTKIPKQFVNIICPDRKNTEESNDLEEEEEGEMSKVEFDFDALNQKSLERYVEVYDVSGYEKGTTKKKDLVELVSNHFSQFEPQEEDPQLEIITRFIHNIKISKFLSLCDAAEVFYEAENLKSEEDANKMECTIE